MRLFKSKPKAEPPPPPIDEIADIHWGYEVSEDGAETWRPETEGDADRIDILRRGAWFPNVH